ncbi:MAG: hypothetical protein JW904_15050 [Spirochaetales bacterium]|nr:hypothetical protein [Spirochaetales bacterium]
MKIFSRYCFILFLIMAIGSAVSSCDRPLRALPQKQDVDTALEAIRKDKIMDMNNQAMMNALFGNIGKWLTDNNLIIRILLISLCSAGVMIGMYLLIRFITGKRHIKASRDIIEDTYAELKFQPEKLAALVKNQEYGKAICYLHNATILILIAEKILRAKNLTNRSVHAAIKDSGQQEAFSRIAQESERVLFDGYDALKSDYEECFLLFKANFTGRTPK